jgi:GT2 family glycosyltransferase
MSSPKLTITFKKRNTLYCNETLRYPVTIIVLTWNFIEETKILIDSIREIPLPRNTKLLFIDNGSRDYTVDYLMDLGIEVLVNPTNLGFTVAVNQGIKKTTTDVILLNNDTAILQKDWIHKMQETAYLPQVGVVGCRLISYTGEVLHAGGSINKETWVGTNIHCLPHENKNVQEAEFVTFGCVYLKRSIIDEIGLLDEKYFAYYEDSDYCFRIKQAKYKVIMDGRVNVLHRESATSKFNNLDLKEILESSRKHFVSKWSQLPAV